ncbi:MAG TPA: Xaa-Pro peptidase family protein [Vicinamibacterales bacterium]|jgi:Xaa-Pro dipeptidase
MRPFSRRRFLHLGSLTAAAAAVVPVRAQRQQGEAAARPLPKSFAGLSSMKARAKPITADERRARIARARELMHEAALGGIVLTGGTSLDYFSNIRWGLSERFFALVLPATGNPFVVSPAFEEGRAREQLAGSPFGEQVDVRVWQEDENPYERVAQGLRDRGLATGRLGVEETVKFVFSDGIHQAAPALTIASATPVTAGCRMIKSPAEMALMRLGSQVTIRAYEAAYRAMREGMTQADFGQLVSDAHERLGFPGGASVQVGAYSALPHGSRTPQVIRDGTILLIDGGCTVEGYHSDISRTFVLGKPTDKMRKVFEIEQRAQKAALAAARPGVEAQSVDAAARKVIVDAGYGPDYKYFTHRVGHGIGLDEHEWPYLVRGDAMRLKPQMVFSDEPGIYIPGEFGIRLEDDMHITESGAELFTTPSPSLDEPFGHRATD